MTQPTSADRLWVTLPERAWPRSPALGLLLADGGWTRAIPFAGLVGPAAAFTLGLARGGLRPGAETTYSHSLPWLIAFLVVALAGAAFGFWTWTGFVVGDLVIFDVPPSSRFGQEHVYDRLIHTFLPHLVSYVLLASLLIGTPLLALLARGSVRGLLSRSGTGTRETAGALAAGLVAAVQAGLWTQAFPLLVRPLWTWHRTGELPPAAEIVPVQQHMVLFAAVAFAAAAAWSVAAHACIARIAGRVPQPAAAAPRAGRPGGSLGHARAAILKALLLTLLLGGLVPGLVHGVAAFVALATAFWLQTAVLPQHARWWTERVPAAIRVAIAVAVSWTVAYVIGSSAYVDSSGSRRVVATDFGPLLFASVGAITVMALLLPGRAPSRPPSRPEPTGAGS